MKTKIILAVAFISAGPFLRAVETEPKLQVTIARQTQPVEGWNDEKRGRVRFWFQELIMSAVYRGVVLESSDNEWRKRLTSDSSIYCRYAEGNTIAVPERPALVFEEALLPLSSERYPDFIFVKHEGHVLRLAKYDPWVLYKLVSEAGFSLYGSLSSVKRGLF